MPCRWLSVNFNFNILSCQNYFSRGYGGVHKTCGNSGGVGGYFCIQKMEIPGRRGELHEIPSVVGVWINYFLELYDA